MKNNSFFLCIFAFLNKIRSNMKVIKKNFELNEKGYFQKHFQFMGVILNNQLSNKESEVLACFVLEYLKLGEEDIFNSLSRKRVMERLSLSHAGLANHLKSIIDKGFAVKNEEGRVFLKQELLPEPNKYGYIISITKV